MFKKILVPPDGTADSERVIDLVKPFARLGTDIHLVTVVDSCQLDGCRTRASRYRRLIRWPV